MKASVLALASLALLAVPALPASASSHCVVELDGLPDLVCFGPWWCTNDGICGRPVCATDRTSVCVNEAPHPDCVLVAAGTGFVCFGPWWCTSDGFCGRPVCVTNRTALCVNEAP